MSMPPMQRTGGNCVRNIDRMQLVVPASTRWLEVAHWSRAACGSSWVYDPVGPMSDRFHANDCVCRLESQQPSDRRRQTRCRGTSARPVTTHNASLRLKRHLPSTGAADAQISTYYCRSRVSEAARALGLNRLLARRGRSRKFGTHQPSPPKHNYLKYFLEQ